MSEQKQEYMRKWRLENAQHRKEYRLKYREEHREQIRAYERKYKPLYKANNPMKWHQWQWVTRAKREGIKIGNVDLEKLFNEWDRTCGICGLIVEGKFELDHIIPRSKGGVHEQSNLQFVHPTCNRKKWVKPLCNLTTAGMKN
jgi:5-methylcytosine-specific restriction endonuclease McrA